VDLVPGAATVTATYSARGGNSAVVTTTAVPRVEGGRVFWSVSSVVTDDGSASDDLLNQINDSIETAWRNYARSQHNGSFTDVVITDDDITFYFD
ncbi:MAG: hypothetical protein AAFV33_20210, partial [Chloroflexota bacterium]